MKKMTDRIAQFFEKYGAEYHRSDLERVEKYGFVRFEEEFMELLNTPPLSEIISQRINIHESIDQINHDISVLKKKRDDLWEKMELSEEEDKKIISSGIIAGLEDGCIEEAYCDEDSGAYSLVFDIMLEKIRIAINKKRAEENGPVTEQIKALRDMIESIGEKLDEVQERIIDED